MKIRFDNNMQGEEFRIYELSTDSRQYFLAQLKEAYTTEEVDGSEIKVQKVIDGEQQYNEVNKRTYPNLEYVLKSYIEREQYDCNAETFEELAFLIKVAHKTINAIKTVIVGKDNV